ncbi:rho GTPase-activating protein 21-like isoform X2 [Mytilus trossulus]|uniref:rho GTPase-activating protein 21-like isoform X2 n=1 Tax=Mytilus trossulus TaxID=6551 RepID=UPI0030063980
MENNGDHRLTSLLSTWRGPRTVIIPKTDQGYGFTLRHFIVYPPDITRSSPNLHEEDYIRTENFIQGSGRRSKHGGSEPMDTIFVKNVKEDSPAYLAGLCTGDRILSVNNFPVTGKTYQQVISLIQSGESRLKLEVLPQDQDILQMAYKNTHTLSQDSLYHGRGNTNPASRLNPSQGYTLSSMENIAPSSGGYQEHSAAGSEGQGDMEDYSPERNIKSTVSYTTSVYREPSGYKGRGEPRSFGDTRKEFETRVKDYSEPPPNKTFSFGLFYPTPKKENRSEVTFRRARDNVLQPNDSQENIAKTVRTARVIPLEKKHSREEQSQESLVSSSSSSGYTLSSSPSRHSYPDSMRNNPPLPPPRSFTSPERQRSEIHTTTRHYVPVVPQGQRSAQMSSSLDNLDSRTENYQTDRNLRTNYSTTRIYEHPSKNSNTRTFIVKINDSGTESENDENSNQNRNSYGTAFALTRSPHSTSIEIKSKERPRVSQRKKQFESGQMENNGSTPNVNRYKTEIQKITSLGKFNSVSSRLQNFEKSEDGQQSAPKLRRMSSTERYSSPEAPSVSHNQNQQQFQEQAPIRIYVSQGSSNNQSSPIVEIVPMSMYQGGEAMDNNRGPVNKTPVHVQHEDMDGGRQDTEMEDEDKHGQKPVRKPSFLAAVTASQELYGSSQDETSPDSPPSQQWRQHSSPEATTISYSSSSIMPPPSSSSGMTLTSTPIKDSQTKVILRKKSDSSPDEEAIKLQRRTSYLMATAKDRDTNKLSLDKSLTHSHSDTDVQMITPKKPPSMTKLKAFFGERTPRILEATERRQDPASPIQEISKMGYLQCKTDIADGKRNSDRSWRPVWVELRGHALFLNKEKKEGSHPFAFDEQPISVKSSMVDIAYDYTKKRNVFRLKTYNGSEYLFQADDHDTMLSWIEAVQKNNNPDLDDQGLFSANLIIRKSNEMTTQTSAVSVKSSPQVPHKPKSRLSTKSIIKIPHSPSMKRKDRKTGDDSSKQKTTLKDRIKSFRKTSNAAGSGGADDAEGTGMFGVPIKCCIPSPNNDFVPMIVDLCTKIVEARGLEVTGVYRVPGNTAAVNMMTEELNKGIDNMNVDHEKWCDVNVISSLLKAFFRKLPESLVTSELYQAFINASRIEDPERRMLKLKRLLHELPEHHFETFKHIAEHLNKVAGYGHINKMDARNLAIVFGPTLVKKKDDDMASIVKDMSDQCRIIESIILHHDWFFGSWDQDDHVPVDEQSETPTNPSVTRLSCDDDDNTVNPKDIVFSIVQAANKKLRGEKDKSSEDLNASVMDGGFSERNIDQEVYRSRMKGQIESTSKSSPDLLGLSGRATHDKLMSLPVRQSDSANDRRMAKSQEIMESDWDFVGSSQSMYGKPLHYSDDSLDKNDELEVSHSGLSGSFSVSQSTIDRLRIIEEEARALREKEEKRKRDFERRKLEKQKIEQNIMKTKKEMEIEDRHSIEDLLSAVLLNSDGGRSLSHHRGDSMSSDHSNSSSEGRQPLVYKKDKAGGGKYFVIQSIVGKHGREKIPRSSKSGSNIEVKGQRTNSLERLLEQSEKEVSRKSGRGRYASNEDSQHLQITKGDYPHRRSKSNLSRSNSLRRGSLDSLIDMIQDGKRRSYEDTDSEDGSDLLSDLTSTFDQKLKVLVNPKYKLNGSSSKLNRSDSSNSSNEKDTNTQLRLPPQLPLSHVNKKLCSSNDMLEKQYQDPSLHRSPRQHETKVGIAYRFERNPSNSVLAQSNNSSDVNNTNSAPVDPGNSTVTFTVPIVSQPTVLSPIQDSRTKNETMSNSVSNKSPTHLYLIDVDKSPIHTQQRSLDETFKARSSSPPAVKRKSEKPKKRRHTVGGTDDLEHFKALVSVTQSKGENRRSAWDQLQPVVKSPVGHRSLQQWLHNERHRGSTPDLSLQHSPKFY